jgi:hypothetical protein
MGRTYSIPDTVISKEIAGEIILLDLEDGTYLGLDTVGARIWQLVDAGLAPDKMAQTLIKEFDVPLERLKNDIETFLATLEARGLVCAED